MPEVEPRKPARLLLRSSAPVSELDAERGISFRTTGFDDADVVESTLLMEEERRIVALAFGVLVEGVVLARTGAPIGRDAGVGAGATEAVEDMEQGCRL